MDRSSAKSHDNSLVAWRQCSDAGHSPRCRASLIGSSLPEGIHGAVAAATRGSRANRHHIALLLMKRRHGY